MAKGQAFGKVHGHVTTIIPKNKRRARPSRRKGKLGHRTQVVRQIIRSVCGFAGYEKRIIELLKQGNEKDSIRAYRFAKRKLGTHKRALRKRKELDEYIQQEKQIADEKREAAAKLKKAQEKAQEKKDE